MTDPIPPGDEGPQDPPAVDPPPPTGWTLPSVEWTGVGTGSYHMIEKRPMWSDEPAGCWRWADGTPVTE